MIASAFQSLILQLLAESELELQLDLSAVMKAAQALSEAIHLDQLISTLMQVVIENAGAEKGCLILLEDNQLAVVARYVSNGTCNLETLAVANCADIPITVIHYVERTQETLVLDDAVAEPIFATDSYIQQQHPRSLLCIPIIKQGERIGILYLENNLNAGAFTSDRLEVLKLLIAQAAISLENARLYARLEDYSETLEVKVEERTQALQQEIADRQKAEEALRQSEERFRAILENAGLGIVIASVEGENLQYNPSVTQILGYSAAELRNSKFTEYTYAEDLVVDLVLYHEVLAGQRESYQIEKRYIHKKGHLIWVHLSVAAVRDGNGNVLFIVITTEDISNRKRAEAALRHSEATNRALISAIPDLLIRVRGDGTYLNIVSNGQLKRFNLGRFLPNTRVDDSLPPDLAQQRRFFIQQALQTGELQLYEQQLTINGRSQDEEVRIVVTRMKSCSWCVTLPIAKLPRWNCNKPKKPQKLPTRRRANFWQT